MDKYFYSPIPAYKGKVLKCQGICLEQDVDKMKANKEHLVDKCEMPGYVIVDGYKGDRIRAEDHSMFCD